MAGQRDIKELLSGHERTILAALGITLPKRGEHRKCPFPYHDDRNPSWRWDDEKAKFFCTCNPSSGSIIDVVIAMRGGDFASASQWCREIAGLDRAPTRTTFRHSKHGEPVKTWSYRDSKGKIACVVARYETPKGKQVLPWIPDSKGAWICKAMPTPRPLYRLPELLATPDKPVLVVEGEKSADAAAKLFPDFVVTTSAGGCKAWKMSDWKRLGGRRVVIWPDNDDQGREYAANVAGALPDTEVLIVEPDDRFPIKWDLADARPENIGEADLRALIECARHYDPPRALPALTEARDGFDIDEKGRPFKSEGNVLKALKWAAIQVTYDEFAQQYCVDGLPGYGPRLDDDALDELLLLIAREYYLKVPVQDFRRIVRAAARRNRFHPVRSYLAKLQWDGRERIDSWLIDYAGAEDTPFIRAVGRIFLIAACRRVRQPGCKFDEMLVLESVEGRDKSTAFSVLAGDNWFTDEAPLTAAAREIIEQLRGHWIVECADLDGMRRAEVTTLKKFLSRRTDKATLKYKEETTHAPRQCVFAGTTNEENYLLSTTGNRRFWPVAIQQFDTEALKRDRDQIWAEAALCEDSGESIRLPRALWADAAREQQKRLAIDEWEDLIANWLDREVGEYRLLESEHYRVTLAEVARGALSISSEKLEQRVIERIAKCLRNAGWERSHKSHGRYFWQKLV